jgi:hypothetical protein
MYFIKTKARCLHPLFSQFLGYTSDFGGKGYFVDPLNSFNTQYLVQYPITKYINTAE